MFTEYIYYNYTALIKPASDVSGDRLASLIVTLLLVEQNSYIRGYRKIVHPIPVSLIHWYGIEGFPLT